MTCSPECMKKRERWLDRHRDEKHKFPRSGPYNNITLRHIKDFNPEGL